MRLAKVAVFTASLLPAALLVWRLLNNDLGVNPVETITHSTGDWALRFLLISLAVTPARKLLDRLFDVTEMANDFAKRPYITAGMVAFFCLLPLALTSTAGWIRRLGGSRWRALHRLAYVAAAAAVVHYYWLVKSDIRLPALYAAIFVLLMLARLIPARRRHTLER
jgi:methionine sulfoxide reductase heme-binding subunit